MASSWLRQIRDHRWLAVRALVVGWTALLLFWVVVARLMRLDDWLFMGGIVNIRPWWPDPARNPFVHVAVGAAVNAAAGWLVGRFHRDHRTSMVLLFFISLLLISDLPRFIPATMASWGDGLFWGIVATDFTFMRLPILVAGIWGVRDRRQPVAHPLKAGVVTS
jgi:hypothetical protein